MVSHDAFEYLGARYDLDMHPIAGLSPDAEPSARHLAELADLIRTDKITTVFSERLASPKLADTLASDLGITTEVLDPIEGLASGEERRRLPQPDAREPRGPAEGRWVLMTPYDVPGSEQPVVDIDGAGVSLGGRPIVRDVDLSVRSGEVVALLGANGSGKSTLVKAMVGLHPLSTGTHQPLRRRP